MAGGAGELAGASVVSVVSVVLVVSGGGHAPPQVQPGGSPREAVTEWGRPQARRPSTPF